VGPSRSKNWGGKIGKEEKQTPEREGGKTKIWKVYAVKTKVWGKYYVGRGRGASWGGDRARRDVCPTKNIQHQK